MQTKKGETKMENQNNKEEYELIDKKNGPLSKVGIEIKQFVGGMVERIGDLPTFAKEVLSSTEKSEENFNKFVKQDKDLIDSIIKKKLESGNYTDDELKELLDRTQKITKDQEGVLDKLNKHKKEIFLVVSASTVAAIKVILDNRNNAS
jgi:hypothetical protein